MERVQFKQSRSLKTNNRIKLSAKRLYQYNHIKNFLYICETRYGEQISFRIPNYTKILNAMRTEPTLTLADMKEITGISIAAIQKLLDQLIQKKYVERGEKDGSWRVFVTQ